jgi:anti-sigma B factor antagonist
MGLQANQVVQGGPKLASKSDSQPLVSHVRGNGYSLFRTADNGDGVTLAVSGEIDIANCEAFTDEVQSIFGGADRQLVLDLRDCVFIDSSGIRALVVLAKEQQARGQRLKLSGVNGEPLRVLRLSGLLDSGLLSEHA